MKVLLIGKNGMLGGCLFKILAGLPQIECFSVSRNEMDITHEGSVFSYMNSISPDFVINAAAYTNVDGAETDPETAYRTNARACEYLAKSCVKNDAIFLHISTDYVFGGSGEQSEPYTESSLTSPLNEYGKSKLFGEQLIKKSMTKFFILRTSSLYGESGRNFVDTIIELSKTRDKIQVVDDQVSAPTYVLDLASVIVNIFLKPFLDITTDLHEPIFKDISKNKLCEREFGIYHIANSGSCSWFEFSKYIFDYLGIETIIEPVIGDDFNNTAIRPNYSVISSSKLDFCLRSWDLAVKAYLDLHYLKK